MSIIEELIEIVASSPQSLSDFSSYWQLHSAQTVAERVGDALVLSGSGFNQLTRSSRAGRVFSFAERISYWRVTAKLRSHHGIWRTAKVLARDLKIDIDYNAWKQTVALAVLVDHWNAHGLTPETFALIGDGAGFLGALIHRCVPESVIYCIDLPKILVFQAQTHGAAGHSDAMSLMHRHGDGPTPITYVFPKDIGVIPGTIDCAINIASMQEMTPVSIQAYFDFIRERSTADSRFYCVNRQEKELPGGEIVRFVDYPWWESDRTFIDGPCPYYTHYFGRTGPTGPTVLGQRVPLVNRFDGAIWHRLAQLGGGE